MNTTRLDKKAKFEELFTKRDEDSKEVFIEIVDYNKLKKYPTVHKNEKDLKTVYENKLENEKSSFFENNNLNFQRSNINIVSEQNRLNNNDFHLKTDVDDRNLKNINEDIIKKIETFYGKNEESFTFFKKQSEELSNYKSSRSSTSPLFGIKFSKGISESSIIRTSDCEHDEVRGKNDVKVLNYKRSLFKHSSPKKKETELNIIKLKTHNINLKKSNSFSYFEKQSKEINLCKNDMITNGSSCEKSLKKKNIDNTLLTYMHEAFEKKVQPSKIKTNKTFIENEKQQTIKEQKQKFHPNLGLTLSKQTTIKVIFIILSLVFISPFVNINLYKIETNYYMYTAFMLNQMMIDNETIEFNNFLAENIINNTARKSNYPQLIRLGFKDEGICQKFNANCNDVEHANGYFFNDQETFIHLRAEDRIAYNDTDFLIIVYNQQKENKIEAGLNIVKILIIAFLLWMGAFIFLRDSDKLVVKNLEKTTKKAQHFMSNINQYFYKTYTSEELKSKEEESMIILNFIKNYSLLLLKIYGLRSIYLIKLAFSLMKHDFKLFMKHKYPHLTYEKIHSTIMIIKLGNMKKLLDNYKGKIISIKTKIVEIISLTVFEHFGEVITSDNDEIIAIWDNTKYNNRVEHPNLNDSKSSDMEDSLKEEYESYECDNSSHSEYSQFSHDLFLERLNINNNENNDISNFIMICVLKILSRLNYNPNLSKIMRKIGEKNLNLHISLHRGNLYHIIINTDFKITSKFIGRSLIRAQNINVK